LERPKPVRPSPGIMVFIREIILKY
jgi:hypothetical protein